MKKIKYGSLFSIISFILLIVFCDLHALVSSDLDILKSIEGLIPKFSMQLICFLFTWDHTLKI